MCIGAYVLIGPLLANCQSRQTEGCVLCACLRSSSQAAQAHQISAWDQAADAPLEAPVIIKSKLMLNSD